MSTSVTNVISHFPTAQNGFTTTTAGSVASGATTVQLNSVAGYTNGLPVVFVIDPTDAAKKQTFTGIIDTAGVQITSVVWTAGTNQTHALGATVVDYATATHIAMISKGISVHADQDGTLKAGAVDVAGVIASGIITDTQMSTEVKPVTRATETFFDFVASGLVWSGDAYASTRNGSMTAGVIYQAGQRMTLSAVTAHSFTASKDTYIDVLNTAGVASVVYTEVANNTASPALAASSVRIGIIVTGATNIAAATSVNQGQETMVLPIASSIAYSVTDSLGNLICPRDPNRKILGQRQILSTFSTASASYVQVTGLSVPVIVPTGRKIKITVYSRGLSNSNAAANTAVSIWDGVVASGTQLSEAYATASGVSTLSSSGCNATTTPSTASKTYNVGLLASPGTGSLTCVAASAATILVELV